MESTGQILKYLSLLSQTHTYSTLNIFIVNSGNYEIKDYKTLVEYLCEDYEYKNMILNNWWNICVPGSDLFCLTNQFPLEWGMKETDSTWPNTNANHQVKSK